MSILTFNEIIEPNDQTEARREHLDKLRELIGNVYPNKFTRTNITGKEDTISAILAFEPIKIIVQQLKDATPTGEKPDQELKAELNEKLKSFGNVRVSGRMAVPPRVMGKAAFVHLSDGKERLQIYVRRDDAKVIFNGKSEPPAVAGGFSSDNNESSSTPNPPATAGGSDIDAWEVFKLLDHGDFIGASGFLFLTNTGELSVHVETFQFLSKSLLPMPDKMHGIADAEIRQRQRYADLIGSSLQVEHEGLTTREVFEIRAKTISSIRRFLEDDGYIEVETPMLTPKATGAAATPFETWHNALDIKLYARIAPELYLKRLVVGGFEKVYELNRNFRNEGISYKHNPEFTMLEFYCAYMDVNGMMDFCEKLLQESVQKATGGLKVNYENKEIDFSRFERLTMKEAIVKYFPKNSIPDLDISWLSDKSKLFPLARFAREYASKVRTYFMYRDNDDGSRQHVMVDDIEIPEREAQGWLGVPDQDPPPIVSDPQYSRKLWQSLSTTFAKTDDFDEGTILAEIFEYIAERKLVQPTFIIDFPKSISPLSKASPENPQIAERFELFINGMEIANGFSELNDPQEQYERFVDQMSEREKGDHEAMVLDEDYIRALAYGMPPAAGIGIGIDRLVMLLTNKHSIRDVILFPHLRPEKRDAETEQNGDAETES